MNLLEALQMMIRSRKRTWQAFPVSADPWLYASSLAVLFSGRLKQIEDLNSVQAMLNHVAANAVLLEEAHDS
jgi:hypothetical protein